jgi:DNA-binding transcriptional LysR family regulator
MDTQQLQAFVAIAECGSFSAAAERLHLTQPAVSKRLALLEEQLDAQVFDRIGRRIRLTAAGQLLLPRAKTVLNEVEAGYQAIAGLRGEVAGALSIATSHHIGLHYLPSHLRSFMKAFPAVRMDLHFLDSEQAQAEILRGRFDLALVTLPPEQQHRVTSIQLWQDELRLVVGPQHPLARRQKLGLRELSGYPAVLPESTTVTTRLIQTLFKRQQLPLTTAMEANHLDTVKMLVGIGMGWGVLPARLIDRSVKVLPIRHSPIRRPLGVIYHEQRTLSMAVLRFLAQLQK